MFFAPRMLLESSRKLHDSMLHSIMRSTIQFFESTPIGRIHNRFSKDLDIIEVRLLQTFRDWIYATMDVIRILILIIMSTYYFVFAIIPLVLVFGMIQVICLN